MTDGSIDLTTDPLTDDVHIVSREFWGAADPTSRPSDIVPPVKTIWFIYDIGTPFCTKGDDCKRIVKLLQARCLNQMKMTDIPFNFLIGGDGRCYEGRGWTYQPPGFNKQPDDECNRIDIGFISNRSKDKVTYQMVRASSDLIKVGLAQGFIAEGFVTKEWNKIGEPVKEDPNKPFWV